MRSLARGEALELRRHVFRMSLTPSLRSSRRHCQVLKGAIPKKLGSLSALTYLRLGPNPRAGICGKIPPELGNLTNLKKLYLQTCALSGPVPFAFSYLKELDRLDLTKNDGLDKQLTDKIMSKKRPLRDNDVVDIGFSIEPNPTLFPRSAQAPAFEYLKTKGESVRLVSAATPDTVSNAINTTPPLRLVSPFVAGTVQTFLATLTRDASHCFLSNTIAMTKMRQIRLSSATTLTTPTPPPPHPFLDFLATYEHGLTDLILSYVDPLHCCNKDRIALLRCWKSLGGTEDDLRQGYGDDVSRWKGVQRVRGGRVVEVRSGKERSDELGLTTYRHPTPILPV